MNKLFAFWNNIRFQFRSKSRNNPEKEDVSSNYERTTWTLIWMIIAVDVVVVFYLNKCTCDNCGTSNGILSFFITSNAVLVGGILLGFLFGIPKKHKLTAESRPAPSPTTSEVNTSPSTSSQSTQLSYYDDNTNLEEISDWLTKIIIGLSLVEFKEIKIEMIATAENIGKIFVCLPTDTGYAIGFSTLIFFGGIGLALGYLWARIKLVLVLTDNRNRQSKLERDFMNSSNRKTIDQAQFEAKRLEPIAEAGQSFFQKVTTLLKSKTISVPEDLQKNRWGGKFENEGFVLSARVTKGILGLFDLELSVSATKAVIDVQQVAFFLHDTFPSEIVPVPMVNKAAKLNLTTYEAFTVGAVVYDGERPIELELDLNTYPGYPDGFYYRY